MDDLRESGTPTIEQNQRGRHQKPTKSGTPMDDLRERIKSALFLSDAYKRTAGIHKLFYAYAEDVLVVIKPELAAIRTAAFNEARSRAYTLARDYGAIAAAEAIEKMEPEG